MKAVPVRHVALDALRGIAVMGILLMNISAFAMPEAGYFNPMAWGGSDPVNIAVWTVNLILVDGKMRALFSMLFGASMLLVIDRAKTNGQNGLSVHLRRMATLLVFGLAHYYLIWDGDILALYAGTGIFVALAFASAKRRVIKRWMLILFGVSFMFWALLGLSFLVIDAKGARQGASQSDIAAAAGVRASLGQPGSKGIEAQIERFRGPYEQIAGHRLAVETSEPLVSIMFFGCETAALMLLGMLLFRTGALTGKWPQRWYWRFGLTCYAIGLPGGGMIAWLIWQSGFNTILSTMAPLSFGVPFQVLTMLGHASFAIIAIKHFAGSPMIGRVAAAGRVAFSNYLGTSLVMTFIFYGYGLGWYGWVNRWQQMVIVLIAWAAMLAWSKPWLDRFNYGPLEWLWRSVARGRWQPFCRAR